MWTSHVHRAASVLPYFVNEHDHKNIRSLMYTKEIALTSGRIYSFPPIS